MEYSFNSYSLKNYNQMLNLSTTFILTSLTFIGCGAPEGRMEYLTQSDGRGKVKYETVAELQDTLAAWNYPNAMALKMSDSVRANFYRAYHLYLVNEKLDVLDQICEAYFPGLGKKVNLKNQRAFRPPDRYMESLFEHSTTVDSRKLLDVLRENAKEHPVQAIVVMGFSKKVVFDDRNEELRTLFEDGDLPPVYCVHTNQFGDSDLPESEFLAIQLKWSDDNGYNVPKEAFDHVETLRKAEQNK